MAVLGIEVEGRCFPLSLPYFLRCSLSLDPELIGLDRLASQQALSVYPCAPALGYRLVPAHQALHRGDDGVYKSGPHAHAAKILLTE